MVNTKPDFLEYNTLPATTPVGHDRKAGWYTTHQAHKVSYKDNNVDFILFGDSILANLSRYSEIWAKYFKPLNVLNLGIGGDRTQHVLWRAEDFDISNTLKCVIIHCGTNNVDRDSASSIAHGILAIAVTFQEKVPGLDILVTGLLPRDLNESKRRDKIRQVNEFLEKLCKTEFEGIRYTKQDDNWVLEDGILDETLYYVDHLHLNKKGNKKLALSIVKAIKKVQGETVCTDFLSSEDETKTVKEMSDPSDNDSDLFNDCFLFKRYCTIL